MAIPVVIFGLGEIGRAIARAALTINELELVGAVDTNPSLEGKLLSDVIGAPILDIKVSADAEDAFARAKGGVLLHATGSRIADVAEEIEDAVRAGLHVVSTCEELAFPWVRNEQVAEKIDQLAEKHNVTVLGTGVNPGFVLDRLLATLAQATGRIERVVGRRVVDASTRREALQRKIGAGMTEADFEAAVRSGAVGHIGLMESAALAAMGVDRAWDEVDEDVQPVVADSPRHARWGEIRTGEICGVKQIARAFDQGTEVVRLELVIALGANDPHDEITIYGTPPLTMRIPGGIPGDDATAWSVVHAAARVGEGSDPGLITVLDLPAGR